MIVYFADRRMHVMGMASTGLPEGLRVHDDLKALDVETGVATLEFLLSYDEETKEDAVKWADAGNFVLRSYLNDDEFYTIIDAEDNAGTQTIRIYAEDAGLDLLNETVGPFLPPATAQPIRWYVDRFAFDSGFEIGVNEIPTLTRTLSWEGHATATARLLSLATQFDNAEISFSFEIRNLSVERKLINIYRRRGQDDGVELRLNRELDNIITKKSVANLATALVATGGTPEGSDRPVTLQGHVFDDGNFHVVGGMLRSRTALAKWSRYLWGTGSCVGHIVQHFSYDTINVTELRNRAVTHLRKISEPEINYEVDIVELPETVRIGDTIYLVDRAGELYLSARVLRLEVSASNKIRKATLGDHLIQDSGVSTRVTQLAAQFEQLANNRPFFTWIVYADDAQGSNISLDPYDKKFMGIASNRLTASPNLSDPSIFSWSLVRGADGQPVVIINHGAMAVLIPSTAEGYVKDNKTVIIPFNAFRGGVRIPAIANLPIIPEGFSIISNTEATTTVDGRLELGIEEGSDLGGAAVSSGFFDVIFSADNQEQPRIFAWSKNFPGSPGLSVPGVGIDNITAFFLVSNQETGILHSNPGWQLEPPLFTLTNRFLWTFERIVYTDATSENTPPRLIGTYSRDGVGIRSTEITYQIGNNGITPPVEGIWTVNIPSVPQGRFLWTRIVITYTDDTSDTSFMVSRMGVDGIDGKNGESIYIVTSFVQYQVGTSGTTAPTGAWTATIPNVPQGHFLWTRTTITYSDTTQTRSFSVSRMGEDGVNGDSGIFISEIAPDSPAPNQLWQQSPGDPIRRWNGTEWVIHFLSAENLEVDSLSAISANMGTITAGTITNHDQSVIFNVLTGSLSTSHYRMEPEGSYFTKTTRHSVLHNGTITTETIRDHYNDPNTFVQTFRQWKTIFTGSDIRTYMTWNDHGITDYVQTGSIRFDNMEEAMFVESAVMADRGFISQNRNVSWIGSLRSTRNPNTWTTALMLEPPSPPAAGQLFGIFSAPVAAGRFGCAVVDTSLAFYFGTNANISANTNTVQRSLTLRTTGEVEIHGVLRMPNNGTMQGTGRLRIMNGTAARGIMMGGSLVSNSWDDETLIPANGLFVRGQIHSAARIVGQREALVTITPAAGWLSGGVFATAGIRYQRCGNMVSIFITNLISNGANKAVGNHTVGTIPAGFRPNNVFATPAVMNVGASRQVERIEFHADGRMILRLDTAMGTAQPGIFASITYAVT